MNGGGGGKPVTVQKQSAVLVCTWNVTDPPVTGKAWLGGVTDVTQPAVSWVNVMSACALTTMMAVRAAPVKFASRLKNTSAPCEPTDAEFAWSHGAVLEAVRLDGHGPVAVSGSVTPKAGPGPVRTV